MIKLFQAQRLSLKKIGFSKGKSLFVIIPISILFAIIVFAASQAQNLITVAHKSIFSPIQGQNEILEISKLTDFRTQLTSTESNTGFTEADVTLAATIENVEKASLVTELPIDIITTKDLFENKKVTVSSLASLDAEYAKLYTNNDFTYTENQPIPIILNANDFIETYEDWGGQTEISVDFTRGSTENLETITTKSPVKTKAISYTSSELIGKTITISFGGLDEISDIKQETTTSGFKYIKLSDEEVATKVTSRKDAISKYWDYEKISTPLTYTFKVVGISEGTDKTMAYVPTEFSKKLLEEYFTLAIAARNSTEMPSSDRNATYTGLVYDGVTLKDDATSTMFAGIRNSVTSQVNSQFDAVNAEISEQNKKIASANAANRSAANAVNSSDRRGPPPQMRITTIGSISGLNAGNIKINFGNSASAYAIPGLVYTKDRTTSELTGEFKSFDFSQTLPLISEKMIIKISSIDVRASVISALNEKGFSFQDFSQYESFAKLESYFTLALEIGSIVFMAITALFILINMAKFVSEGRKEIGIFRAIGATKGDIRKIFILQTLSYVLLAIIGGFIIGWISLFASSSYLVTSAQTFISSAIGSNVTLSGSITANDFISFDWKILGIYTSVLLIVTLIVSLIPASQAAKVSPVEAIRNS